MGLNGIIFAICFALLILVNIETPLHLRYWGRMKRGVKIFSEKLPDTALAFLKALPGDLREQNGRFIRKQHRCVLIRHLPEKDWQRKCILPCVGYADLTRTVPEIQYRVPLSALVVVLFFMACMTLAGSETVTGIGMTLITGAILYARHLDQVRGIRAFIREQAEIFQERDGSEADGGTRFPANPSSENGNPQSQFAQT